MAATYPLAGAATIKPMFQKLQHTATTDAGHVRAVWTEPPFDKPFKDNANPAEYPGQPKRPDHMSEEGGCVND